VIRYQEKKEADMGNRLLEEIQYKIDLTKFGTWRRYGYANGANFEEFKSHTVLFGLPLVHYTYGRNPETGGRVVAKGILAVGRFACGVIAIGHVAVGLLAIGQLAVGIGLGFGQFSTGVLAIGQAALGGWFGLGQFATGYIAIGQVAFGQYVLAQVGKGEFVLSMQRWDPEALKFFKVIPIIGQWLP